ncbi:hypothetical protein GCM10010275_59740 [Streptomyces litmocidini]|uniref:helicase-related protein n=1 Tax=Streptomyces litmocidini TaxID=67318 RepID=UPI0019CCEDA0|nr:helicase-related protein [Streptomyces litmocidini]GGV10829.1 hypothetical protein GCM10010275_59740 [Streptomyces litmocidini]
MILPDGPEHEGPRAWLGERDVPYRVSRYWEEAGQVGTVDDTGGGCTELVAAGPDGVAPAAGPRAVVARDAFAAQGDALEELPDGDGDTYVPVDELLPADRAARAAGSTEAAVRVTRQVTGDGGGVLVCCGSKRGARSTALAPAAHRGVPTAGVDADDAELVERLCTEAGVRPHHRDRPYKREAEQAFRAREAEILVATSTVAAGVDLPARAVVVCDTPLGLDRIEVSMAHQVFGRAGRIGAGEREGWASLLSDPAERAHWQARLAAGHTVRSRLDDHLADHLLAEAVRERVPTLDEAEHWWAGRLAAHQGHDGVEPLHEAAQFLARWAVCGPSPTRAVSSPARWAG